MVGINPWKLKKDELILYFTGRCRHRHLYVEHPNCFLEELGKKPKRGFFDIETSNLHADFGIMLSYAIKVEGKRKIYANVIDPEDLRNGTLDKNLVKQCIDDLFEFDEIVTFRGSVFDLPFVRSRALYWGFEFPKYGYMKHKDVYYMVRNRLRLHRNRLEDACRLLGIKGKTHLDGATWTKALTGDKKALAYVLDHNKRDVIILEKLYHVLEPYVRETRRSI